MLRGFFWPIAATWGLACVSGCFGSVESPDSCDLSDSFGSPEAKIHRLESRYALGTRTKIRISGNEPLSLESSDPNVVRIDRLVGGVATLSFVGEGRATLVASNDRSTEERAVEVARHATFMVVLSEYGAIPLGPLDGRVLLAGPQYVVVIYLDADRKQLYGDGLAELHWSSGLEPCSEGLHSLEFHCLMSDSPGEHDLWVRVHDEELAFSFETVPESELVGIEVLRADEDELAPGTWTQVDIVGVAEDGRHVQSVHPVFETANQAYIGYFAYQYDPQAPPERLDIRLHALEWAERIRFRGEPSDETAFGCKRQDGTDSGPIPAAASLVGMAFFIRLGCRRRREV